MKKVKNWIKKSNLNFKYEEGTYQVEATIGELLVQDYEDILGNENLTFILRRKKEDKPLKYKMRKVEVTPDSLSKFINLRLEAENALMILNNGKKVFFCMARYLSSMPHFDQPVYLLIPDQTEINQLNISFSPEKQFSQDQLDYEEAEGANKVVVGNNTYMYSLWGNKTTYSRIIISFPSVALRPVTFKMYAQKASVCHETDLVISIADRFGSTGSYLLRDDYGRDIEDEVTNFLKMLITSYRINNQEVHFTGVSKGATTAAYYAQKFDPDSLTVVCPQVKLPVYLDEIIELGHYNSFNFLYFLWGENLDKYLIEKLSGEKTRYIYSPLDETSDQGYGRDGHADEKITVYRTHPEIAVASRFLILPFNLLSEIPQQTTMEGLKVIEFKDGVHLSINELNLNGLKLTKRDRIWVYLEVVKNGVKSYIGVDVALSPNGELISANLESEFLKQIENVENIEKALIFINTKEDYFEVSIKAIEYCFMNLPEPKFNTTLTYSLDKVRVDINSSMLLTNPLLVCDYRHYNRFRDELNLSIDFDRKTIKKHTADKFGIYSKIGASEIYMPIDLFKGE